MELKPKTDPPAGNRTHLVQDRFGRENVVQGLQRDVLMQIKAALKQEVFDLPVFGAGRGRRRYSRSGWSGSYTWWREFCDHPGTAAPSSGRSWSPERTTGPVSG